MKKENIIIFSTPFDYEGRLLYGLNVPFFKVASFEITDIPLIEYIASKRNQYYYQLECQTKKKLRKQ